jgi:hypothetical protein
MHTSVSLRQTLYKQHNATSYHHPYELIGAQFQALFMLLRDAIRHIQEEPRLKSGILTLAHIGLGRAQACLATAQAAYS